jgi:hypothetical protein
MRFVPLEFIGNGFLQSDTTIIRSKMAQRFASHQGAGAGEAVNQLLRNWSWRERVERRRQIAATTAATKKGIFH